MEIALLQFVLMSNLAKRLHQIPQIAQAWTISYKIKPFPHQ
jgi:hypothetical protein